MLVAVILTFQLVVSLCILAEIQHIFREQPNQQQSIDETILRTMYSELNFVEQYVIIKMQWFTTKFMWRCNIEFRSHFFNNRQILFRRISERIFNEIIILVSLYFAMSIYEPWMISCTQFTS